MTVTVTFIVLNAVNLHDRNLPGNRTFSVLLIGHLDNIWEHFHRQTLTEIRPATGTWACLWLDRSVQKFDWCKIDFSSERILMSVLHLLHISCIGFISKWNLNTNTFQFLIYLFICVCPFKKIHNAGTNVLNAFQILAEDKFQKLFHIYISWYFLLPCSLQWDGVNPHFDVVWTLGRNTLV